MGKVALITGASSGIGRYTAIALSAAGWNVVLTARRKDCLEDTVKLCPAPEKCLITAGDITDEEFVCNLFRQALELFGRVDLLFNNAGTSSPQVPIEELSLSAFQTVINVNLIGPFLCTREAFKVFKKQSPQGGRIINNGSLSAHVPRPHSSPYSCSKHAVSGLTKCTALDGRVHNITCTQIDIGNAQTDMASRHSLGALQPDGRIIPEATFDPKHVANAIVHIAGLPNDVAVLEMNIMRVLHSSFVVVVDIDVHWRIEFRASQAPFIGRG